MKFYVVSVSFPKEKGNEAVQAYKERMDREEMEVKSLQKRIQIIYAEGLELDKRADEAFSAYGTNVLVIMLFHGLGSVFLQLNYPYFGTWVSVCMVVSFFSTFLVAIIVCDYKTDNLCQLEKDLQRRQIELQNDIANFGAETKRTYSVEKLKTLESIGALGEVLNGINRDAGALQSTIAGILENSSKFQSNRMKSLIQVGVCAIIYGLSFPMMTSYLLYCKYFIIPSFDCHLQVLLTKMHT